MATERIRTLWRSLEPRGQLDVAAIGVLGVVVFYFLFQFASKQSYSTLVTGARSGRAGR